MGVSGNFRDRQSPLEQVLSKIVSGKEGAEVSALHDNYSEICDTMIDGLVDASEFTNFVSLGRVRFLKLANNTERASSTAFVLCTFSPQLIRQLSQVPRLQLCFHISRIQ